MANNFETRVTQSLDMINGQNPGDLLLSAFKSLLLTQNVFKAMFGASGERIFINDIPNYNESILPLFEMYWGMEHFENSDVYETGSIDARLVLPIKMQGNFTLFREIAAAFKRFMGGAQFSAIFSQVPGLIEFGAGTDFDYTQMIQMDGFKAPVIRVKIPYRFDLKLFQQLVPQVDMNADLDAALVGNLETYGIQLVSDEGDVLVNSETLVTTGQTNG